MKKMLKALSFQGSHVDTPSGPGARVIRASRMRFAFDTPPAPRSSPRLGLNGMASEAGPFMAAHTSTLDDWGSTVPRRDRPSWDDWMFPRLGSPIPD